MRDRITLADLQAQCDRLNRHFGYALKPYSPSEDGVIKPNPRVFHISQAYGGVAIHQMAESGTGVRDVIGFGHAPKREVYDRLVSLIDGVMLEARQ